MINFFSQQGLNMLNKAISQTHNRLIRCQCCTLQCGVTQCIFIFTIRSLRKLQISIHGSLECTASQLRKLEWMMLKRISYILPRPWRTPVGDWVKALVSRTWRLLSLKPRRGVGVELGKSGLKNSNSLILGHFDIVVRKQFKFKFRSFYLNQLF